MNKILVTLLFLNSFSVFAEETLANQPQKKTTAADSIPNVQIDATIKQGATTSSDFGGHNVTNGEAKISKKVDLSDEGSQMALKITAGQNQALSNGADFKISGDIRYYIINGKVVKLSVEGGMGGGKDAILGPSFFFTYTPVILDICTKEKKDWTFCSVTKLRGEAIYAGEKSSGVKLDAGTGLTASKKVNGSLRLTTGVEYKYVVMGHGDSNVNSGHQVTAGLGLQFDITSGTKKK